MSASKMYFKAPVGIEPPVAHLSPLTRTLHGVSWDDPWAGLEDPKYPKVMDEAVLAYLKAENAYFDAVMEPAKDLTEQLFAELKSRIKENDDSVPAKDGAYMYQTRYRKGGEYRLWLRWPVGGGDETLLLDENKRAEGHDYYRNAGINVSNDGRKMIWAEDTNGSERYHLYIRDIDTETERALPHENISTTPFWDAAGNGFFYVVLNDQWRPYLVKYHTLGTDIADDLVLYEETDPGFFVGLTESQSRAYLFIGTGDGITSEIRVLPLNNPRAEPVLVSPRRVGHQYDMDHGDGRFYIRTNDTHKNFRIVTADESTPKTDDWTEYVAPSDTTYIKDITAFAGMLVVEERRDGLDHIRLLHADRHKTDMPFTEAAYSAGLGNNPEYAPDKIRVAYQSMVTPPTVMDFDPMSKTFETKKVQEIPSGYDPSAYASERIWVTARDGAKVPVSIVYKKDFQKDGSGKLHLYAYGAYGIAITPSFSTSRLSLLDRGFAYAIAHIRGGDDMGYHWYEDGKLDKRTNTFHDFIDVAKHLNAEGWAAKGNISASGGSAGGSLMGYILNAAPELWRAVIAHVPFVDILNTMVNDTLPLTPIEWPEWGNPITDQKAFEYIRSYSPYDNVTAQVYPPIMVTAGLNDPRVTYWEPAKWVAKLRATKTDENVLVLKTNMGAGHGGKSGRFTALHEVAEEYSFLLRAFHVEG